YTTLFRSHVRPAGRPPPPAGRPTSPPRGQPVARQGARAGEGVLRKAAQADGGAGRRGEPRESGGGNASSTCSGGRFPSSLRITSSKPSSLCSAIGTSFRASSSEPSPAQRLAPVAGLGRSALASAIGACPPPAPRFILSPWVGRATTKQHWRRTFTRLRPRSLTTPSPAPSCVASR